MPTDFRPAFRRPYAYDYRIKRGVDAPALSSDEYAVRITGLLDWIGNNSCTNFGLSSYFDSSVASNINNIWYKLIASQDHFDNNGELEKWLNQSNCPLVPPTNVWDRIRITVNPNLISQVLIQPAEGVTSGDGTIANSNGPTVPVSGTDARFNTQTNSSTVFEWGYNGWIFVARGPLTAAQVQNAFDNAVPV